jgi:polyhydroxyalkanoate synthesis repressor PhaR
VGDYSGEAEARPGGDPGSNIPRRNEVSMHRKKTLDTKGAPNARLFDPRAKNRIKGQEVADKKRRENEPITIKKYANRRLYNTATSSYVTLDHLCQMVKDDMDFVVYDAKSGEDITRPVLTQIIVEEESKGQNLLPITFLRQLISFYGDNLQWVLPRYLEHMMSSFATNQDQMRKHVNESFGGMFPFNNLEEMGKQNLALFERTMGAMNMFSPFGQETTDQETTNQDGSDNQTAMPDKPDEDTLSQLKEQVDQLQKQLNAISQNQKKS